MNKKGIFFGLLICNLSVGLAQKVENRFPISRLKFLGEYDVPHKQAYSGTTIGGLSGIDYDPQKKIYYLISDDRSAINAARFYTASIRFNENGIQDVQFVSVTNMLGPDGKVYPNSAQDPAHTPDPESMRYDALHRQLIWSSEGERIVRPGKVVLEDPAITAITTKGNYIDTFILPPNMHMHADERGPRQNGVFEGLTFADHFKTLYVNVEEPIYEDGSRAGLNDSSGWIRIIRYLTNTRKPVAEYAYQIDPVAYPPNPPGAFKINGVPDILWLGNNKLMITERSFSTGRSGCVIKIYQADLKGATNVLNIRSVKGNRSIKPVRKKLLLNMDALGIYIDNIEGATFGPRLPNGHRTLIFVADDNFAEDEKTQFLLFEVFENKNKVFNKRKS